MLRPVKPAPQLTFIVSNEDKPDAKTGVSDRLVRALDMAREVSRNCPMDLILVTALSAATGHTKIIRQYRAGRVVK